MPDLLRELARLGHVARVATLHSRGFSPSALRSALARGLVLRPRRGWVASPLADRDQLRAIAIGGRIGCASALRRFGVWSGVDDALHLQVPRTASRLTPASRSPVVANAGVWHPSVPLVEVPRAHRSSRIGCRAAGALGRRTRARRRPRLDRLAPGGARPPRSAAWTPSTRARRSTRPCTTRAHPTSGRRDPGVAARTQRRPRRRLHGPARVGRREPVRQEDGRCRLHGRVAGRPGRLRPVRRRHQRMRPLRDRRPRVPFGVRSVLRRPGPHADRPGVRRSGGPAECSACARGLADGARRCRPSVDDAELVRRARRLPPISG